MMLTSAWRLCQQQLIAGLTNRWIRAGSLVALLLLLLPAAWAVACPFCSAVDQTLSEEIKAADAVILARIASSTKVSAAAAPAPATPADTTASDTSASDTASSDTAPTLPPDPAAPLETIKITFDIVEVVKGQEHLEGVKQVEVLYYGEQDPNANFMLFGVDPTKLDWSTPLVLTDRGMKYISDIVKLPESGPDRLAFFQDYFEDEEPMLSADAYDEFAKAPYADILPLKDVLHREKFLEWLKQADLPPNRRRLYLTLLGVCDNKEDIPFLEEMIQSPDRQVRVALDALIGCYLTLKGPDGLPLVEELFLKNKDAEYVDTYATIMALRFHGQETKILTRERLTESMRHLLDRPQLADLVIPDLARWQDWSVMDRLVELFKNADDESKWVRVPVVNYLRAIPDTDKDAFAKAQVHLVELKEIDPDAVRRASSFYPLPAAVAATSDPATAVADGSTAPTTSINAASQDPPVPAATSDATAADAAGTETASADGLDSAADEGQDKTERAMAAAKAAASEQSTPSTPTESVTSGPSTVLLVAGGAGVALLVVLWLVMRGNQRLPS